MQFLSNHCSLSVSSDFSCLYSHSHCFLVFKFLKFANPSTPLRNIFTAFRATLFCMKLCNALASSGIGTWLPWLMSWKTRAFYLKTPTLNTDVFFLWGKKSTKQRVFLVLAKKSKKNIWGTDIEQTWKKRCIVADMKYWIHLLQLQEERTSQAHQCQDSYRIHVWYRISTYIYQLVQQSTKSR